jgi:hypothetical protein
MEAIVAQKRSPYTGQSRLREGEFLCFTVLLLKERVEEGLAWGSSRSREDAEEHAGKKTKTESAEGAENAE